MAFVARGYFLAPRGVKGELFFRLYEKEAGLPRAGDELYFPENEGVYKAFRVEDSFSYEKGSVIKIDLSKSKDEAAKFKGVEFFSEGREADGAFPGREIISYEVHDASRGKIGTVEDFSELRSYFLLHCRGSRSDFEIPLAKGLGARIDRSAKRVEVDLPRDYPGVDDED